MMTLKQMIAAYQRGDRWIAADNSKAVTAKTEAAARRDLKSSAGTPKDREWNDQDDTCGELCRAIGFMLTGCDPWDGGTIAGEADLSELTMDEIVVLGKAIISAERLFV